MSIERGAHLEALTAGGTKIVLRALGPARKGRDFPVVPVATEEDFERGERDGGEVEEFLWPLAAVRVLQP